MADATAVEVVQIKVWLLGISPMAWRRLLVPSACTLHELHGVIQVAMGSVKKLGRYAASGIAWWPKRPSSTAALT